MVTRESSKISRVNKRPMGGDGARETVEIRKTAVARVFVLYTGGTIGMTPDAQGVLAPGDGAALSKYVRAPDRQIWWDIGGLVDDAGEPVDPLDSSSVGPDHWRFMAAAIEKAYDGYDGFVILHGTDTMAYTASALSFLLQNLGKPVIVTGSQLPISQPRTDAVMNFTNALYIAGYKWSGLPALSEVVICFGDVILRGNRTTKISTSKWQGFDTPNYPKLGTIGEHIVIHESLIRKPPKENSPFFAHKTLEPNVATVPIYPGMSAKALEATLNMPDINGFVLRSFGAGNTPEDGKFLSAVRDAIDGPGKKILVNTTQCLEGTVEMGLYAASSGLQSAGVLTGLDLTPEAALTKMMWLLAAEDHDEVLVQMQIDQRGEQTGSVFDVKYGKIDSFVAEFKKAARPSGQFQTQTLKRATLRAQGVEIEGAEPGQQIDICVFINLPNAKLELANEKTPQYAGKLTGKHQEDGRTTLLLDITRTITRVHETGRPLQLALIPERSAKFSADGVFLTLFNS